ncbi:DsbA family protein [Sphingomonas rhizophila]|uniref:DsbA family protein n=1 Tax=Sphingomonas rhizophila TaxID=2071607 RepID=A0A7G9S8Z2_9SPHN|nr:DsbA family protein [Sphingomonas rhizophila]QNN64317.1 DsbA family protein [Sphingomonas rhizophila]
MSETGGKGWTAAIVGGAIGAVIGSAVTLALAPKLLGERMVREALVAHPDILVQSNDALRDQQYAPMLAASRAQFETPFHSSWKGAAKPDVVLTYFYDYACGYCRKSNPDLERLVAEDKGLRIVYRELPILGPDSIAASRVALAASKAGKFAAFHDALYEAGRPTPQTIAQAAAAAGVAATPTDAPDQEAELKANFATASQLGATGTPLFIVGDRVMNSAVGYDALKEAIAVARKTRS